MDTIRILIQKDYLDEGYEVETINEAQCQPKRGHDRAFMRQDTLLQMLVKILNRAGNFIGFIGALTDLSPVIRDGQSCDRKVLRACH